MKEMYVYAALIIFSSFISAFSQVLLKKAAMREYESRLREYLNAPVIIAYMIFVLATLMTVYSYRGVEVSQGTLLETSGYIFVFIFDLAVFHERLTWRKLLGTGLILAGIAVTVLA